MTPFRNMAASQAAGDPAVPLLLTEGVVKMLPHNPEHVIEEIQQRATQMSQILEDILHESHGLPRWGLNE